MSQKLVLSNSSWWPLQLPDSTIRGIAKRLGCSYSKAQDLDRTNPELIRTVERMSAKTRSNLPKLRIVVIPEAHVLHGTWKRVEKSEGEVLVLDEKRLEEIQRLERAEARIVELPTQCEWYLEGEKKAKLEIADLESRLQKAEDDAERPRKLTKTT
jgi:hypothetical protein